MRLASFAIGGRASYGMVVGDAVFDLGRRLGPRYPSLRSAIAAGLAGAASAPTDTADYALAEVTLLPPVPDPEKIICVGLNYRAHAAEGGFKVPQFPSVFSRFANTLVASGMPLVKPQSSGDFDYEGELAIIIGRGGRHLSAAAAQTHLNACGATHFSGEAKEDNSFYEIKYTDPDGIIVEITASGWGGASKDGRAEETAPQLDNPQLKADRSQLKPAVTT